MNMETMRNTQVVSLVNALMSLSGNGEYQFRPEEKPVFVHFQCALVTDSEGETFKGTRHFYTIQTDVDGEMSLTIIVCTFNYDGTVDTDIVDDGDEVQRLMDMGQIEETALH